MAPKPKPKSRASKSAAAAAAAPILAARTPVSLLPRRLLLGAHVSASGGVHNSVANAHAIGANSFALFLKQPQKWAAAPLSSDVISQFRAACAGDDLSLRRSPATSSTRDDEQDDEENIEQRDGTQTSKDKNHRAADDADKMPRGYDAATAVLPHGSYLVNLAQADEAKGEQAYSSFVDDMRRCGQLGIRLFNFHPGSAGKAQTKAEGIARIAERINRAHRETAISCASSSKEKAATSKSGSVTAQSEQPRSQQDQFAEDTARVVTVIENMAGAGNIIGSTFEDLRDIIAGVSDKTRVGVCLDTCHAFAAGYDLRTPDGFADVMRRFDEVVGYGYLRALHLNDSKAPLGSNRDRHANIGTGFLGLRAFHSVVNHEPFQGMPMILETPIDEGGEGEDDETEKKPAKGRGGKPKSKKKTEDKGVWAREIKLLERLIGMDPESEEFKILEKQLHAQGVDEREKFQDQADRRMAKAADAGKRKTATTKQTAGSKRKRKVPESEDEEDDTEEHAEEVEEEEEEKEEEVNKESDAVITEEDENDHVKPKARISKTKAASSKSAASKKKASKPKSKAKATPKKKPAKRKKKDETSEGEEAEMDDEESE